MGKMGMMGMGMMGMGMGAPEVAVDPVIEEEAAAVGDPHLTLTSGVSDDLCCESGVCKPCPVALLQETDYYSYYYYESLLQEDNDDLGMGMGMMGMGMMGMRGMGMMGMRGMGMMGMGMMGMGMMGMGAPEVAVDPIVEEEAAAVGDPHMTLSSGASDDLCCESGICKPCPVALLQESDYYSDYYYESLLQEDELGMGMGMMGMGMMGMGKMGMMGMGKMGMMGMGMMGMGMGAPEVAVDPVIAEEAAAVGDPHMTSTVGQTSDLCCDGSNCWSC